MVGLTTNDQPYRFHDYAEYYALLQAVCRTLVPMKKSIKPTIIIIKNAQKTTNKKENPVLFFFADSFQAIFLVVLETITVQLQNYGHIKRGYQLCSVIAVRLQ